MTPIDIAKFEQLKATGELPSPKGPALAIIRLTQKDDVTVAELAHAISPDPAFVGRLIKAANGAQALGRRPVASIGDAVSVLGISVIRTLALGFSLVSEYSRGQCVGFNYEQFWSHALVRGIAMQAVGGRVRAIAASEAFTLGLLARIGDLALATVYPQKYTAVLQAAQNDPAALIAKEQETFALCHAQVAEAMLRDWGFPTILAEPLLVVEERDGNHYDEGSRAERVVQLLVLADFIADVCLAPEAEWRNMMPQLLLLGGKLSLDAEVLMSLCDQVARDWAEWGPLLQVQAKQMPPFGEMSKPPAAPKMDDGALVAGGEDGYRMRVLVVDDDRALRSLLRTVLTEAGHEVFEAESGRSGFELALELRPQILICDWMMPEMNGIELTRALRETALGRNIYVLLLTALDEEDALVEAFQAGADDFMSKPLKPKVLAARLRAGQRVVKLQQEVEHDREEIRRFAAELAITNRKLQRVALTDFLTGFPNRRYAMERFQQEWAASLRKQRPLSCMVVDVDMFKQVNDTYGHDAGDQVLRNTSAALKAGLRSQDIICRIGGDEFLILCPDTALDAAVVCAERVRKAVSETVTECGADKVCGSVSIGVAERSADMGDMDDLIKRADEGAYAAKDGGRNRVVAVQLR
ncbi:MAG TPA: diguanylate cyclase [Rhodocyclaceae bacterium]